MGKLFPRWHLAIATTSFTFYGGRKQMTAKFHFSF